MAKRNTTTTKPAAPATTEQAPTAPDAAQATATSEPASPAIVAVTSDTPPAAPAAPETSPEQAAASVDPSADPTTPPAGDETAPPATADGEHPPLPASIDVSVQTDQSQEILDGLAEVKQPEIPVLDRVMARLAATLDEPFPGYASTSPEVTLSGEAAALNVKLFLAMQAEGVPCHRQGETLQFLLEQLAESLRRF